MSTDIDYENPWTYNGKEFGSSDILDYYGFVYHIHCNTTNRDYIGRKYFWSFRPPGAIYRDWETDRKSTRLNSSHRL